MSALHQENIRYPKIFLVCANSALLPPDVCLPLLFHSGLDANWIDRRIGLNEEAFLKDLFLRTNIAFELFPKSIFLYNVNVNKLNQGAWLQFLRLIKRLSSRDDKPIRLGLMHDTSLLEEEGYRAVCTDDLLIRLGTNQQQNISQLMQALGTRIQERRKFPRLLCDEAKIDAHVTFRLASRIHCARVFDLSTGHFSCMFQGRAPSPDDLGQFAKAVLSIGQQEYGLQARFELTREVRESGWPGPQILYVFSFSSQHASDPQMVKRINHHIFTWSQQYTQSLIEEKRSEYLALQQEMAELRASAG